MMYYIILEEETPEEWTASYTTGLVPEGDFDVLLHSDLRYGVYTVIKSNCPYYWAVGSTIEVRKP
jgi:hypothetical protein